MESEVELNDVIQEMHVVATVPYLYHILIDLNAVQSLLQLLNHENTGSCKKKPSKVIAPCVQEHCDDFQFGLLFHTDISIAVVDLLQEMTDVDSLAESEEGADILLDALVQLRCFWPVTQLRFFLSHFVNPRSLSRHTPLPPQTRLPMWVGIRCHPKIENLLECSGKRLCQKWAQEKRFCTSPVAPVQKITRVLRNSFHLEEN